MGRRRGVRRSGGHLTYVGSVERRWRRTPNRLYWRGLFQIEMYVCRVWKRSGANEEDTGGEGEEYNQIG